MKRAAANGACSCPPTMTIPIEDAQAPFVVAGDDGEQKQASPSHLATRVLNPAKSTPVRRPFKTFFALLQRISSRSHSAPSRRIDDGPPRIPTRFSPFVLLPPELHAMVSGYLTRKEKMSLMLCCHASLVLYIPELYRSVKISWGSTCEEAKSQLDVLIRRPWLATSVHVLVMKLQYEFEGSDRTTAAALYGAHVALIHSMERVLPLMSRLRTLATVHSVVIPEEYTSGGSQAQGLLWTTDETTASRRPWRALLMRRHERPEQTVQRMREGRSLGADAETLNSSYSFRCGYYGNPGHEDVRGLRTFLSFRNIVILSLVLHGDMLDRLAAQGAVYEHVPAVEIVLNASEYYDGDVHVSACWARVSCRLLTTQQWALRELLTSKRLAVFPRLVTLVATHSKSRVSDSLRTFLGGTIGHNLDELSGILQNLETFVDPWFISWRRAESDGEWKEIAYFSHT